MKFIYLSLKNFNKTVSLSTVSVPSLLCNFDCTKLKLDKILSNGAVVGEVVNSLLAKLDIFSFSGYLSLILSHQINGSTAMKSSLNIVWEKGFLG